MEGTSSHSIQSLQLIENSFLNRKSGIDKFVSVDCYELVTKDDAN